jgi:hypothetical protein
LERAGSALLLLLCWVLPFEAPLFRVGPLQLTTVELSMYAMLAVWALLEARALARARGSFSLAALRKAPMLGAALGWIAVLLVSAAAAPTDRAAAFKFALRGTSGVLVFFAARRLGRRPGAVHRALVALLCGALLSAASALVDSWAKSSEPLWRIFRDNDFDTFGLARASGVFAYPTIGAMYWEAALPLLVAAPFAFAPVSRLSARGRVALAGAASALLVGAILASATRSGLAGAAVGCASMVALAWNLGRSVRTTATWVLGVLFASWAVTLALGGVRSGIGSLLGERLRFWHDESWFGVEYRVGAAPAVVHAGEWFHIPITLRNTGTVVWPRAGDRPTRLAYHWEPLERPATLADYEGVRTELPIDVPPGGALGLLARARGPASVGAYRLRWDLVQEDVTWFSDRGNPMPVQEILVAEALDEVSPEPGADETAPVVSPPPPARPALWRAAVTLWRERPLLGVGPDNFRRRYPSVLPLAPTGQPYSDTRIHANNLYFETLADLGLAGVAALAAVGWALVRGVRAHRAAGRLSGLASGVAAGTFFIHGLLDYFFEFTPLFGLFWLLLGLEEAARSPAETVTRAEAREGPEPTQGPREPPRPEAPPAGARAPCSPSASRSEPGV